MFFHGKGFLNYLLILNNKDNNVFSIQFSINQKNEKIF